MTQLFKTHILTIQKTKGYKIINECSAVTWLRGYIKFESFKYYVHSLGMASRDLTFNWFLEQIVLEEKRKNTELRSKRWTGTGSGSSNEQITKLYKFQHKFPIVAEKGKPK